MKLFLVDDDPAVLNILRIIIEDNGIGTVCGTAADGREALEELAFASPDIVLADLLMPVMDGIDFVRQAKQSYPHIQFIMLSHVTAKEMVAEAYEVGVEFFIHKPVNSVEVLSVLGRVKQYVRSSSALRKMQQVLLQEDADPAGGPADSAERQRMIQRKVDQVLQRLGISGYPASRDITQAIPILLEQLDAGAEPTVAEICANLGDSSKTTEQRMRRAVAAGLSNLAHLGIEDYANDIFQEYAHSFYQFEQVRREMDHIRGKTDSGGRVSLKKFLYALADQCHDA